MKTNLKKLLFTILPIMLGVFLIWLSLSKLSPEDIVSIKSSFRSANYIWVALSLALGILSHLSRAYRWLYLLEPLGYKPKFYNSVMAVLVAYLFNLGIPRSGEIARATTISKYEKIPFDKALGTIVAERAVDVIMLLIVIFLALLSQFGYLWSLLLQKIPDNPIAYALLGVLALSFLMFLYLIRNSKNVFFIKIREFFFNIFEGGKTVFKMKNKWWFLFHTLFIWAMYILMFYVVTFSLTETSNLPLGASITGFVVGSLSIAATNGGLGTYPIGVQQAIILYNVAKMPALAFGWIMWTGQTAMIIIFGGLSFFFLPLINKYKA